MAKDEQEYDEDYSPEGLGYSPEYSDGISGENRDNRWELDIEETVSAFKRDYKDNLTEKGVKDISIHLRKILDKNFALTNLKDEEIKDIAREETLAFSQSLLFNRKKWGLELAQVPSITSKMRNLCFAHCKRSYKDGERKYRQSAYNVNLDDDNDEYGGSKRFNFLDLMRKGGKKPQTSADDALDEGITQF